MKLFAVITLLILGCSNPDSPSSQSKLLATDFRLFQGTIAWELAKATRNQDVDAITKILSKQKSLVNFKEPRYGTSLLSMAAKNEKFESMEVLLQNDANPNIRDSYKGETPLIIASAIRDDDEGNKFIKLLLKYGADPNLSETGGSSQNVTSKTPLLVACSHGITPNVEALLKNGADINYKSPYGETALYYSILTENFDLVLLLLKKGADYKQPMFTDAENKKVYIVEALRMQNTANNSNKVKQLEKIFYFLKERGVKKN